jgi:hypothetical protein
MENKELVNNKIVIDFLNKCNIKCNNIEDLQGIIIDRDCLIIDELYNNIKTDISDFKSILNSSVYTSMQKNAAQNQRWPLLNLIRQLLRRYDYDLKPKRQANGYTKDGKKKYKRYFEIKKKENKDEIKEITIE